MIKALVFDMDGTIAGLYDVPDWLSKIRGEDASPYLEAEPLLNLSELYELLDRFSKLGVEIVINSWLAKGSTPEYDKAVRQAKIEWLKKHNFPYDEIHITKYGRTKADATRHKEGEQVLFDDNIKVRNGWNLGRTVNEKNIMSELIKLLLEMEG